MARKRDKRYREVHNYPNFMEVRSASKDNLEIDRKWDTAFFENKGESILELGCGRGEYSRKLAEFHPEKNFIGVDIKGDRLCLAARYSLENNLSNIFFVRLQAEHMPVFFPESMFSEIWIPFPDPHAGSETGKKRLTSSRFLDIYRKILVPGGKIHLKTDDEELYKFTMETVASESGTVHKHTADLYNSTYREPELTDIKTTYEKRYLAASKTIKYICFSLI